MRKQLLRSSFKWLFAVLILVTCRAAFAMSCAAASAGHLGEKLLYENVPVDLGAMVRNIEIEKSERPLSETDPELRAAAQRAYNYLLRFKYELPPIETSLRAWRRNGLFRQSEFYDAIGTDPKVIESLYRAWYGEGSVKFPVLKELLPPRLLALSLDPGIIGNFEPFVAFARDYLARNPMCGLLELRQEFSKRLGTKKYFRALALDQTDFEQIVSRGISPRFSGFQKYQRESYPPHADLDQPRTRIEAEMHGWVSFFASGPKKDMRERVGTFTDYSLSQSVSEHKTVATAAAMSYGKPGQTIYVFELAIPKIEVTDVSRVMNGPIPHESFKALGVEFFMDTPGIEGFILGTVDPSWIISVSKFKHGSKGNQYQE